MRFAARLGLVVVAAALGACGPPPMMHGPGTLTIDFKPMPAALADLTLSAVSIHLSHIGVFGDLPPSGPPPSDEVQLDGTTATGMSLTVSQLPPGLYSRVEFAVENAMVSGSWRGTPLTAHLGMTFAGSAVDLRSPTGQEVGSNHDGEFTVDVDVGSWFGGDILDTAMIDNGTITCDMQNNPDVTGMLNQRVSASFSLH